MIPEIVKFTDGGFEVICRESYPSGFTNHRIGIKPAKNFGRDGWRRMAHKAFEPDMFLPDLHAAQSNRVRE